MIENRIGRDRDDQSDQSSDHGPKGQDHPDEHEPQVKLNPGGHRRKHFFGMAGQFDPGDRE